jgi:acetyl-CoA acyltransferase
MDDRHDPDDRSVVLVAGCRTPFLKSFTDFADLTALDLMTQNVGTLLASATIDPRELGEIVVGSVVPPAGAPNVAREVVFRLGLPKSIPGVTLGRACASGLTAIEVAADGIRAGRYDVAVAGGVECLSDIPVPYSREGIHVFQGMKRARGVAGKVRAALGLRPGMLLPREPGLTEASTGLTMGEHAEKMAQEFGIPRKEQDDYAFESHRRAYEAEKDGFLSGPVAPTYAGRDLSRPILADNGIRRPPDRPALDRLRPAFDRRFGTITAGNASFLTDGAAAVLLMSAGKARALGYRPMARIALSATVAMDPADGLLMGPPRAIALVLGRAGLELDRLAVLELHEAFAAQVLCNVRAMESADYGRRHLARDGALGAVDPAKLNPAGGSLAIGHPFGATGPRLVMGVAQALVRHSAQWGMAAACAAGAMAQAILLEGVA